MGKMEAPLEVGIVPAGQWGLVLGDIAKKNRHNVTLYLRDPQDLKRFQITRTSKKFPNLTFSEGIQATDNLAETVVGKDLLVLAPPSTQMRSLVGRISQYLGSETLIVSATKGMEQGSNLLMSEIIKDEIPYIGDRIGAISGPNLAKELAYEGKAATDIGLTNFDYAKIVQAVFHNGTLRVYPRHDLRGVEIAGVLKNVLTIAAGISDGLGYGQSTKASLFARAMNEMVTIGTALGGEKDTFTLGQAGAGDLSLCFGSQESRNNQAGFMIARGYSPEQVLEELGTVEGIFSVLPVWELAYAQGLDVPIVQGVKSVVHDGLDPKKAVEILMSRPVRF